MKMLVRTLVVVALSLLVSNAALRSAARGWYERIYDWTAARETDPVGFLDQAERRLKDDAGELSKTRRTLRNEMHELNGLVRKYEAELDVAKTLACEFREAYQQAGERLSFPIVVRNAAYMEDQAEEQVALLLSQRAAIDETLENLWTLRGKAEDRLRRVTAQHTATVGRLEALPATRAVVEADQLDHRATHLVGQIKDLLDKNTEMAKENPVRSLEELAQARPDAVVGPQHLHDLVREFLAAKVGPR